jgi:hypothetical protein
MRTSPSITQVEKNAYTAFCQQHNILNDESPAAIQNGEHIGGYVAGTWGEDLTEQTLTVALEKLRDRLTFIPAEQVECAEILAKLDQGQRDAVASWLSRQSRLETEGPKGFSNVSVLVAWLLNRRYSVDASGLDMALGNAQNSGHRKIWWKDSTKKESREYVHGRPNHAFNQEPKTKAAAASQEYVNGRKNHAYTPPEEAQRVAAQPVDSWQQIIDIQMKQWVTPSQQVKLENELSAGVAAGRSRRDISSSLAALIRDQQKGR